MDYEKKVSFQLLTLITTPKLAEKAAEMFKKGALPLQYRFNAEGNQISYRCDVKRVTTINYDRNVIRTELGKLNKQADETSTKIDLCLVTSKVDYEPPFDANSSFAEAFEAYTENARA